MVRLFASSTGFSALRLGVIWTGRRVAVVLRGSALIGFVRRTVSSTFRRPGERVRNSPELGR
jgi:hypothetical protein